LLPGQNLTLEDHLADVEPVAEQVGKGTARERDPPDGRSRFERSHLGDDALFAQVDHKQIEAAKP
jgi:hypothetical protein